MTDGTKTFFTGLLGLVAGIMLTVFGVSEINKRVISTAEELGKTKAELNAVVESYRAEVDRYGEDLQKNRQAAEGTNAEIESLRLTAVETLQSVENEKLRLKTVASEIGELLDEVSDLSEEDATKQLKLLSSLAQGLSDDDSAKRLLELDQSVKHIDKTVENLSSVPIGAIIPWHKSLFGTPDLPEGWVECNGDRIDDIDSPYHNLETPNLNSELYSHDKGYYLRGGTESGKFNESTYYTDNGKKYSFSNTAAYYGATYGRYVGLDSNESNLHSYAKSKLGDERRFQTAAMTVVWIMRVK